MPDDLLTFISFIKKQEKWSGLASLNWTSGLNVYVLTGRFLCFSFEEVWPIGRMYRQTGPRLIANNIQRKRLD